MMADPKHPSKCAKPATSVHLNYKVPPFKKHEVNEIKFHNKVNVTHSSNQTYFSAIQFWPCGYCGIQQRSSPDDKIAIFSLWNDGENNVQLVESGSDVKVKPFGGEGTGLKSTRHLAWCQGEDIGFTVTVNHNEADDMYTVRCDVEFRSQSIHMATFQRKGAPQSSSNPFVSFVEDYNRCDGAYGMTKPRACTFTETHCIINGTRYDLTQAIFTKCQSGYDAHGNDRCTGGVNDSGAFYLTTGNAEPLDNVRCHGTLCEF